MALDDGIPSLRLQMFCFEWAKWKRDDFQKVHKEMSNSRFSPKWDEYETSDYSSDHWIDGLLQRAYIEIVLTIFCR